MIKRLGIIILFIFTMCAAIGQDTLSISFIDTEPIDCSNNLLQSWRKAYPFRNLEDSVYAKAFADTLLDKSKRPFKYSNVKLAADSIKTQVRLIKFDESLCLGLTDYRFPLFVKKDIPTDKRKTVLDIANDFSHYRWDYMEPANNRYQQLEEYRNLRDVATYNYVRVHPSRYDFAYENIELPPALTDEEVSTIKSLEGVSLEIGAGVQTYTKIGDIQSLIKTDRWHHVGSSLLQLSQTALSDNWYKGGENNMVVSTVQKLSLTTYDENKKTSFDILLDLRLSALYQKADTVNPMRVNDNIFSLTVKYGYQAWKRWFYSTSLYAKTPIFDYHNTNSAVTKSTFLSPLESNVSIGMEYKYQSKDKKLSYTLLLAPVAYNLKYVSAKRVNETSFGIEAGKCSLNKFGSTINSALSWNITNDISWVSRLYCFTSYDNIQVEFENTFNIAISRRFSCQIYLYPRFDDSFDEKIQMKEMLTFGINYAW